MMKHNEISISEVNNTNYTSVLEEGDYIPYFVYKNNGTKISIQNSAGKQNLFITVDKCNKDFYLNNRYEINTYIICTSTDYNGFNIIADPNLYRLFPSNKYILTSPNLKIVSVSNTYININITKEYDPPIIVVPNVITPSLKDEIIEYYNTGRKNIENKGTKNRTHVFTDPKLTRKLDDKLSKSLFPELKKIFNIDITYRENYKTCGYNSDDHGKFHAHRDSVYPYGHRRLAMSLILNDDYEGGGIIFPEYSKKVFKPESCSAVIFPTPLYHQVLEVTGGTRYVIISFLLDDHSANYKKSFNKHLGKSDNINSYKINIVRDQRNLIIDDICPQ